MKQFLFALLFLLSVSAQSQYNYIVYAGSGFFSIQSDDLEYVKTPPSLDIGGGIQYIITDNFEIINEFGMSIRKPIFQSYNYDDDELSNPIETKVAYTSLIYRLVGNYYLKYPLVSLQVGVGADQVMSNLNTDNYIKGLGSIDILGLNFNAILGLGFGFDDLRATIRYEMGLNNPYKEGYYLDTNDEPIDFSGKHHYVSIMLTYPIIKK